MANSGSRFLSVMVIGKEPEKLMEKYSKALKVKPYIKYKYLDANKLKENASKMMSEIIANPDKFTLSKLQCDYFKERLKAINSMTTFEYYRTITDGLYYDEDGNALSEENPNGKWDKFSLGKNFSYPLKLKNGKEVYQAHAIDVDWESMNMNSDLTNIFKNIWELTIEDKEPSTQEEENLKINWSSKKNYLSKFKTMDEFINHNCAYWNYAFLDENGWVDADDAKTETEWINGFFDRFISKLKDDDLVTIFEYSISN